MEPPDKEELKKLILFVLIGVGLAILILFFIAYQQNKQTQLIASGFKALQTLMLNATTTITPV